MCVLLQHGCDLFQQDPLDGYNILHAIVALSVYEPHKETQFMQLYEYIKKVTSTADIKQLLHAENKEGFRPMEFATKEGQFGLFWVMLHTEGVYLARHEIRGGTDYKWYDITEYESIEKGKGRWDRSPLVSVMMMDQGRLACQSTQQFLHSQFFTKWVQAKQKCSYIVILLMFFMRIFYIGIFFWYQMAILTDDSSSSNSTQSCRDSRISSTTRIVVQSYLMIYSGMCLIALIATYLFYRFTHKCIWTQLSSLKGPKNIVLDMAIYHFCGCMFNALLLTGTPYMHVPNSTASHLLNLSLSACLCWHIMYMAQMFGYVGHFVIMMQAMMFILLQFLLVFILMCLPWVFLFRKLIFSAPNGEFKLESIVSYRLLSEERKVVDVWDQ